VRTYHVEWKGKKLAVEAIVEGPRVQMFSAREILPHGYIVQDDADAAGNRARGGQTFHGGEDSSDENQKATAFSAWTEADRLGLMAAVRTAARATDGAQA
jgi:ribosomal protein S8E